MRCIVGLADDVRDVTQYWIDYGRVCFKDGISVLWFSLFSSLCSSASISSIVLICFIVM